MSLKTKQMWRIFQPIEDQTKKLSELLSNNPDNSEEMIFLRKIILHQLNNLSEKFESPLKENVENYQDLKKKITSIIDEFCTMDFDKKTCNVTDQLDEKIFITLIEKFLQLLENLEKLEILPLKQNLEECLEYVKDMGAACEIEDLQNIKELGTSIADLLGPLQIYRKNLISNFLSDKLSLYCCQLYASFAMLFEVVKEQHQLNTPIYTCKKYVCHRICLCFESIISILDAPTPSDEYECSENENNFVYRVDLVLDMITSISNKTQKDQINECGNLWLGIEDVFAHAMSIAQVCQPYNFKAISGSCQTILTEYENLKTQLHSNPPDPTMNNLYLNTLTDALYRLERKINIAVLTLVMEVFSDPFSALKKLIKICGTTLNAKDRTKADLNSAIEEFDQLTDKAMQIGKFATASCRDKNRANGVKNCLASFESLEMELVPAILAFYLHPDNKEMRSCVKLLTAQWQLEMNKFHHIVNLIIDPAVYCQIVFDDLQERVNEMSKCLDNKEDITQSQVQIIVLRALSLSRQINATIEDIGQQNIHKHTLMIIREFKAAIYEADAVSKKFLVNKVSALESLRVINRCEMMLKVIKQLLPVLSTIVNNSISMNTIYSKSIKGPGDKFYQSAELSFPSSIHGLPVDQKSSIYIRTPYSVKNCKQPLSIQPANTVPRNESDVSILIPYIEKGRIMRTEWSVMYKTPKTGKSQPPVQNQLKMKNLSSVRQHLFSRDSFLEDSEVNYTTESLDLTNILENITGLSNTLNSISKNNTSVLEKSQNKSFPLEKMKNLNKVHINNITKKFGECSTTGGGDAPSSQSSVEKHWNSKKKGSKMDVLVKI